MLAKLCRNKTDTQIDPAGDSCCGCCWCCPSHIGSSLSIKSVEFAQRFIRFSALDIFRTGRRLTNFEKKCVKKDLVESLPKNRMFDFIISTLLPLVRENEHGKTIALLCEPNVLYGAATLQLATTIREEG